MLDDAGIRGAIRAVSIIGNSRVERGELKVPRERPIGSVGKSECSLDPRIERQVTMGQLRPQEIGDRERSQQLEQCRSNIIAAAAVFHEFARKCARRRDQPTFSGFARQAYHASDRYSGVL
ncbi:hypothetical protein [Methylosinus sp. PW1]|uniref:hypothetical protein n=1 Tax=Methylosinus sp. PW1 TaxID=107636 RepID=UPI0012EB57D0|nr:hypothetical protein [Methylosinus sp. PW1]